MQVKDYFCRWLCNFIHNCHSVLSYIFFSNEAWFRLSSYINTQNFRVWSSTNPHMYQEASLHPLKVGVWCDMSHWLIIGLVLFDLWLLLKHMNSSSLVSSPFSKCSEVNAWSQHYNAHPHTTWETTQFLQ